VPSGRRFGFRRLPLANDGDEAELPVVEIIQGITLDLAPLDEAIGAIGAILDGRREIASGQQRGGPFLTQRIIVRDPQGQIHAQVQEAPALEGDGSVELFEGVGSLAFEDAEGRRFATCDDD